MESNSVNSSGEGIMLFLLYVRKLFVMHLQGDQHGFEILPDLQTTGYWLYLSIG